MIKFKYMANGTEMVKVFDKYQDMLRFVATSRIKDEDFVGLQFGADDDEDKEEIIGIDGLCDKAMAVADQMDEQDALWEAAMEAAELLWKQLQTTSSI